MGASKDVLVVLSRVFAQGAPGGITRMVSMDEGAGGEEFVADFDKVGTAEGVGSGNAVGIPVY